MRVTSLLARGFTLIELMVALAIFGILLLIAAPVASTWLGDNQIQAGAESVAGGMRYAMAAAIKHNENVEFVLGANGWVAQTANGPTLLQTSSFAEGASKAVFTVTPAAATTVTFNGLGQVVPNADASASITRVRITHPGSGTRPLEVQIAAQRVKLCDPAYIAPDPKGC
jgi:type IV fimbrial biogenesis protein FimT